MYLPKHFEEERVDVLGAFLREHPFATLVSRDGAELMASHLPLLWDPEPAPFGKLTGHLAKPNPHARADLAGAASIAIFAGPQAYVSPSWYPAKREHGKVVPTWNYLAVHAHGTLELVDDTAWLRALVRRLTDVHERDLAQPWQVSDAPEEFLDRMLKGIVGVEIRVDRLEGKWKLSQNRPEADQEGTIRGLEARGDPGSVEIARAMSESRRERSRTPR